MGEHENRFRQTYNIMPGEDRMLSIAVDSNTRLRELVARICTTRDWNMITQIYSENTYVPVAKNCFAFMFTNVGDTIGFVNGMVVFPSATPATALGDSRTISGHELDIYKGNITLSFLAPINAAPNIELVQLYYI